MRLPKMKRWTRHALGLAAAATTLAFATGASAAPATFSPTGSVDWQLSSDELVAWLDFGDGQQYPSYTVRCTDAHVTSGPATNAGSPAQGSLAQFVAGGLGCTYLDGARPAELTLVVTQPLMGHKDGAARWVESAIAPYTHFYGTGSSTLNVVSNPFANPVATTSSWTDLNKLTLNTTVPVWGGFPEESVKVQGQFAATVGGSALTLE